MDTGSVLQAHQDWLEKVKKAIVFNQDAAQDATLPLTLKQQRIDELKRRIDDLERQRSTMMQRFDEAIADHRSAISQLQGQVSGDKSLLVPPSEPAQPPVAPEPPAGDVTTKGRRGKARR
jgi:hypothetical protein